MLRLLEMQKQLVAPLSEQMTKSGEKAYVQLDSLDQIQQAFNASKDSFAYELEMTENPQLPGGSLLKVVEDFNSTNDPNKFSKSEEKILSKRLFGNERYKLIEDDKLSVNLLSNADKKHLKGNNTLIKAVTNKDVLSKLDLKIGETALITINNVVYKVTNKGLTTPYNIVSELGLDKKDIKNNLSSFTSEYNNEMNNWLGYDKATGEYLPFSGKPTQIYQIQTYYEKEMSKVLENNKRPNYGIKQVITAFSDNKSNLDLNNIPNLELIDEVNTESFTSKIIDFYNKYSPNIVVVFDDGSSVIQGAVNLVVNNKMEVKAEKVTNAQKGLFVINTKGDIADQIQQLRSFFIANNIPNVGNKLMIIKSDTDKSNYNEFIKDVLVNPLQSVGLSKNFSKYEVVTEIVNKLRSLGYLIKPEDILSKGTVDVLPSLLTKSEDGKKVYSYILQNADNIKAESDMYIRAKTTLSDKTRSQLGSTIRKSRVTKTLPHNMKHQEPDRNGLSMSQMRLDLVEKGIKTTFDAIIAFLRTQTSRNFKDKSNMEVGEIVRVTTYGRAPIYVKITNISDKSVGELLLEDINGESKLNFNDKIKKLNSTLTKKSILGIYENSPSIIFYFKDREASSESYLTDQITREGNNYRIKTSRYNVLINENLDIISVTSSDGKTYNYKSSDIGNSYIEINSNLLDDVSSKSTNKIKLTNLKAEDLQKSKYAQEWSKKQGWDISYMMLNIDSLKDKYDIDFEYIPDIEEYGKETNQVIVVNKFGWSISDPTGDDRNKALNSNGYIGYVDGSSAKSKVGNYIRNASDQGIPMNDDLIPSSSSVVFVAVPDSNTMSQKVKDKILTKAIEVLEAKGVLLMSTLTTATNERNKNGEGVILKELFERYNNLTAVNILNYTKYSLPDFEKDLEEDGQIDQDCK
jgi:hypothetical protein